MNNRIDQITKGLISLAIMLMFMVALIAGQARANLPGADAAIDETAPSSAMNGVLEAEYLRKLESLPHLFDTFLALPIDTEFLLGDLSRRSNSPGDTGSDKASLQ